MLVIVELAKTGHIPTGFTQFDSRFRHEVNDIYLGFDLINRGHVRLLDVMNYRLGSSESQIRSSNDSGTIGRWQLIKLQNL